MRKAIFTILMASLSSFLFAGNGTNSGKDDITNSSYSQTALPASGGNKIYYGGGLGLTFGSYTRISIKPIIGYKITPKLSLGVTFEYEYIKDKRYPTTQTYSNYGGSVFSRFRIIPQIYLHAEYAYMSYEFSTFSGGSVREGVPFLFLGGGFSQQFSPGVTGYFQILFDVLNNENSPYASGEPFYSVGVSVGF
ncbi:MAG: hypothetical protein GXO87_02710 [Chlorobi bacterium]|nr:hypothetical protein [Chlorobiota bacterium]